jgi:hypothetical protein
VVATVIPVDDFLASVERSATILLSALAGLTLILMALQLIGTK